MRKISLILVSFLVFIGCVTTGPIVVDVNTEIERFLQIRKWEGIWYDEKYSGSLDASVELVKNDNGRIEAIYAWGDSQAWNIKKGVAKKEAKFYREGDKLILAFGASKTGDSFKFYLDKNGNLIGHLGKTTYTKMHPVKNACSNDLCSFKID